MSEFDLSQKQATDVTAEYDAQYILEKIKLVKTKKKVNHPGAYLLSALKMDYKEGEGKSKKPQLKVVENTYQREAKAASEIGPLRNKYMSYKLKIYTDYIGQQAENIQAAIRDGFEGFLKPNIEVFKLYKKSGLVSPFVMADFMTFVDKQFPKVVGDYMDFDDYITSEEG